MQLDWQKLLLIEKLVVQLNLLSAYLMKHPIEQTSDVQAKFDCEKFVANE